MLGLPTSSPYRFGRRRLLAGIVVITAAVVSGCNADGDGDGGLGGWKPPKSPPGSTPRSGPPGTVPDGPVGTRP